MTEYAIPGLLPGCAPAFERAPANVAPLLAGGHGCLRHRLVPTHDSSDVYLLEVVCRDLAAHPQRFEPSDAHARFMAPLAPMLSGELIVVHISAKEPT